ncbi:MAG: hypothetical protein ACOZNI_33785 [Myxococcota bacterium]
MTFREDSGTFPIDTALATDTGDDDTPDHWLTMRQSGVWAIAGDGASMTGELVVVELLDGDEAEPACTATWALVGLPADAGCEGCELTFDVEHTRVEGEGDCRGADLPEDGDVRTLGYDGATLWWDYGGTGVWVPLYDAEPGEEADTIAFSWEATAAVVVEEEME